MARQRVVFASFADVLSADALVAFLSAHQIEAHVEGADPLSIGLRSRVRVVLAEDDLGRARRAVESAEVSESELWFAATGERDPEGAQRAFARREWRAPQTARIARNMALAILALGAAAVVAKLLSN